MEATRIFELPLGGVLGSGDVCWLLLFGQKCGLLSDTSRGYLYKEKCEDEGRIQANVKRQHLNLSNDGIELF